MSDVPFLGEIMAVSFNFPPRGWALCNGQVLQINQNQALFSLLGTTYGGDGRVTFALPNLQGRVPIGFFGNHNLGERGGEQSHTLGIAEVPTHVHSVQASSSDGDAFVPAGTTVLAKVQGVDIYQTPTNLAAMNAGEVGNAGGSQAHENMQPYLTLTFCIALQGIFPSQT